MTTRIFTAAIVLLWLGSMSWLAAVKVLPALREGTPPDYREEFIAEAKQPPPVAWNLYWNERPIGISVSQALIKEGIPSELRSLVKVENLELREVLGEAIGGFSMIASSIFGNDRLKVDLSIATRLRLDWEGELDGFETSLKAADGIDFLFVRGQRTDEDKLLIKVFHASLDSDASNPALSKEFNLPTKARYADAFSPRSRMTGLSVGQRWTTTVVSPLPGSESIQLVESLVEKQETIIWHGVESETFVVIYRYDSGRGAAARDPVGRAWVRDDGTILRQELPLGSARIRFERTDDARAVELAEALDPRHFDRLLHRQLPAIDSK